MKKNKEIEQAEFIKLWYCEMYISSTGTFWRCLFSVCLLILFDFDDADTLETLGLAVGLSSVGKALGFKRKLVFSVYPMLSRNWGECWGSYDSSAKWNEQILVQSEGLNAFRLQNSSQAALPLFCSVFLPQGERKKFTFLFVFSWLSLLQPYTLVIA
jgi:hypothetical protein